MEPFEHSGFFWTNPEDNETRRPGQLTFDNTDGLRLRLFTDFEPRDQVLRAYDELPTEPFLYGLVNNRCVTLSDCQDLGGPTRIPGPSEKLYRPRSAYFGGQWLPESFRLSGIGMCFTDLPEWADSLSGGSVQHLKSDERRGIRVRYTPPEPIDADIPGIGILRLRAGAAYPLAFQREYRIAEVVSLEVKRDEPQPSHWWLDHVMKPLRDLLTLAARRPNMLTKMWVTSPDATIEVGSGTHEEPLDFVFLQTGHDAASRSRSKVHSHEMSFRLSTVAENFETVIERWFAVSESMKPVWTLYFAAQYRPLYVDNDFLMMVMAVEAYHRRSSDFAQSRMEPADYEAWKTSVLASVPPEVREQLEDELRFSNEVRLRRRLTEICSGSVKPVADDLFHTKRGVDAFISDVVGARNGMVHSTLGSDPKDATSLFWLTRKLRFLLEACLLKETGLPLTLVTDRPDFKAATKR